MQYFSARWADIRVGALQLVWSTFSLLDFEGINCSYKDTEYRSVEARTLTFSPDCLKIS